MRILLLACAFVSIAFSQKLPSYQWVQEVDGSGTDSLAGLGTDAQGNIYIAGSTMSAHFPVKAAVQGQIASSGLYRFDAIDTAWMALGLTSASSITIDAQNPGTLYAVSSGTAMRSTDGGVTFTAWSVPSSQVATIAIQPANDQVLYAATFDQGVLKSADGGATWTTLNAGMGVRNLWIDPNSPSVLFAEVLNVLERSGDGGASWQQTSVSNASYITFDTANPGVLYIDGRLKSTDDGQTFTPLAGPAGLVEVIPDPNHSGRLIGAGNTGIFESTDGGSAWTQQAATGVEAIAPDWANGVLYAATVVPSVIRISSDLQTITPLGPPAIGSVTSLVAGNGHAYAASYGSADVYVTKLDPSGNIVYSTYFGGSANDQAVAMAVDAAGNVYVTGTTASLDFPVSKGAYASSGNVFMFKLNPDGSLGYSTYFSGTVPEAVAVDGSGSAWLAGTTEGGLPVTPGALATTFCCAQPGGVIGNIGPEIIPNEASLTRFNASGSSLIFSTYVAGSSTTSVFGEATPGATVAVASDDTAYVGGAAGIFDIDSTGSSVLSSMTNLAVNPQAMAFGPDGSLYVAGAPENFQATPGAFQTGVTPIPSLPYQPRATSECAIIRVDPTLANTLAATLFGSYAQVKVMTTDAAGNVYIGGSTGSTGLPTRTPFVGGFASPTGFMSELSGDLTTLLFSSYFGDNENFTVSGVGIGLNGSVVIGDVTGQGSGPEGRPTNLWLNSLALTPPPASRIDAVENAASLLDGPISAGETIVVSGAGFGTDAQLSIGGAVVAPIAITPGAITATVPAGVSTVAAEVQVQSGGVSSNPMLMPVAVTSPGIFSADGTGYGQGYILNKDGTLNTPANPAAPGDRITIYATGVGPVSFTQCCAVTEYPVNVYIDTVYCDGVEAVMGPVNGFPGSVYRITVYVPNPAVLFATTDPGFAFPPLDGVVMQINGVSSQIGVSISIAQ